MKFLAAVGCDGEYTKYENYAPLQLSRPDYRKWSFVKGDYVVIIGGQSRKSRMFQVDEPTAKAVKRHLAPGDRDRDKALNYLESEGFETGSSGSVNSSSGSTSPTPVYPDGGLTRANRLQRKAETEGIESLDLIDQRNVANRLMQIGGWDYAWEWFERQYGEDFDPKLTHAELKSIAESFDDLNVEIPSN